ncbi:unnamed protein product [Diatraea saccharalis]|uniref:Uncharacterized protein n=1 Tax=Diatraea saccharalis TaxID=40085 RepID=A0A9N9RDK0_9NEOP|nr:unnamed protein product [Diatraea saccharalis]
MIVSNLIQNTRPGSPLASQLSAQIISDLFSSGSLPCGCPNPFFNAPNIVPNSIPNFIPNSIPNFIPNNVPNFIPNSIISPNFVSPNLISPNVLPNIVSTGVPSANSYPINIANLMSGYL